MKKLSSIHSHIGDYVLNKSPHAVLFVIKDIFQPFNILLSFYKVSFGRICQDNQYNNRVCLSQTLESITRLDKNMNKLSSLSEESFNNEHFSSENIIASYY